MIENSRINVGDVVEVYFGVADALFDVTVLSIPSATGDCWILKNNETNTIHYVQQFEVMTKKNTPP
jgi:hypothetical protein